ncbi:MAG: T9SS type A sorting domain-containing protein, partial [Muribaculaceae bacterium]
VGSSRLTANVGNISHTEAVKISQHVSLAEGWSWLSLYSGSESAEEFAASYKNVQEMRSQSQLMYNDEKYGFFGSLTSLDNSSSYRVNVKSGLTIDYIAPNVDLYSNDVKSVTFNPGWTWFSSPYCKDHNFQEVFAKVMMLPENSRIISHTGFMTFSEETSSWAGTLESLNAGEGYLVYNAGVNGVNVEFMPDRYLTEYVPSNNESNAFDLYSEEAEWEYNPHRFADNMSIIANFPQDLEIGRYSIGAFVNGECRGEGKMIGRRFFITVAGQAGETVDFQLFDRATGEYTLVDSNVAFSAMEGTLSNPLTLKADVTGVDFIRNDGNVNIEIIGGDIVVNGAKASDVKVYTVSGKEVGTENLSSGIYIVKVATENGVITRKVVK